MKKYQIIYADPPWKYWAGGRKNASRHYNCMDIDELCALPISDLADVDCALFMWVTFPILPDCFKVMEAWGFCYSTCAFNWVKRNKKSLGWFWGLGNWTRANSELCLLATKGSPKRVARDIHQIVDAPVMRHSKKPDEVVRDRIVALMGNLPRIELFARRKVDGWDCWGNEVESDIELKGED